MADGESSSEGPSPDAVTYPGGYVLSRYMRFGAAVDMLKGAEIVNTLPVAFGRAFTATSMCDDPTVASLAHSDVGSS